MTRDWSVRTNKMNDGHLCADADMQYANLQKVVNSNRTWQLFHSVSFAMKRLSFEGEKKIISDVKYCLRNWISGEKKQHRQENSKFAVLWGWFNASFITKTYFRFNFVPCLTDSDRSSHREYIVCLPTYFIKCIFEQTEKAISKLTFYKFLPPFFSGNNISLFLFSNARGRRMDGQIKTERFVRRWQYSSTELNLYPLFDLRNSDEETESGPEIWGWVAWFGLECPTGFVLKSWLITTLFAKRSEREEQDLATPNRHFGRPVSSSCWFWRKRDRLRRKRCLGRNESPQMQNGNS